MTTEETRQRNLERRTKNSRRVLMTMGALFALIILVRPLWGLIGVNIHYGEGERSVKVIRISQRGYIWKTYEIEGATTQGGFASSYIWDFSIDNEDPAREQLWNELKSAFESGQTVKIKYDQRAGNVPWRGGTCYFAKEVIFP